MKIQKAILFLLVLAISIACDNGKVKNPVPKDVIPVDTMMMVMEDLFVLENAIRNDFPQLVQDVDLVKNSGDEILKKYHIEFARYETSLTYYLTDQDTMKYIYNHISDGISERMNKIKE